MNGQQVVIPEAPTGFNPITADAQQLSYYGYPARPNDRVQLASWRDKVMQIRPVAPPPFLIQTPYSAPFRVSQPRMSSRPATAATCSPINLCWGGYVNTGTTFTQSYIDYSEPGQAATACSGDAVIEWTGLGGYDGGLLGQDGTLTYLGGVAPHTAWWEAWPENNITPMNFSGNQGDDIQSHVYWLSSSSQFEYWVWDTTTGQQQTLYYGPRSPFDGNSSEFIVERPPVREYNLPATQLLDRVVCQCRAVQ